MGFLESEIERCERRLVRIAQNPDPSKLRCTGLLYELERDVRREQLEASQSGKPLGDGLLLHALLRAMGFVCLDLWNIADRVPAAAKHFEAARALGLPDLACDRTVVGPLLILEGEVPRPDFVVPSSIACDPALVSYMALARMANISYYCIDRGLTVDAENLHYVTMQLESLIAFAEKNIPGIHYDEERLRELQEYDRIAYGYMRQVYELKKRVPCPLYGEDAFRIPRLPSFYPDPPKALQYYEALYQELAERADRGFSAVENERLRLMWTATGVYSAKPFGFLKGLGVAVPHFQFGIATFYFSPKYGTYGDEKDFGRRLSPLEEQARAFLRNSWGGLGTTWVEDTLDICQDLHIDGLVNFLQKGCTTTLGIARMLSDCARNRLGIPSLNIEGRQLDTSTYDQKKFEEQLEQFVEVCSERKTARQGMSESLQPGKSST